LMLPSGELESALATIASVPVTGPFFRTVAFKYLQRAGRTAPNLLSGVPGRERGGRYNTAGGARTTYIAESPETALSEGVRPFLGSGVARALTRPLVMLTIQGQLRRVLDLLDPRIQSARRNKRGRACRALPPRGAQGGDGHPTARTARQSLGTVRGHPPAFGTAGRGTYDSGLLRAGSRALQARGLRPGRDPHGATTGVRMRSQASPHGIHNRQAWSWAWDTPYGTSRRSPNVCESGRACNCGQRVGAPHRPTDFWTARLTRAIGGPADRLSAHPTPPAGSASRYPRPSAAGPVSCRSCPIRVDIPRRPDDATGVPMSPASGDRGLTKRQTESRGRTADPRGGANTGSSGIRVGHFRRIWVPGDPAAWW
jgi:hypothetical protein